MKLTEVDDAAATRAFRWLPRDQQPVTLSPGFAQADTAREAGLTCRRVLFSDGERMWLNSVHLRAFPADPTQFGAISPYGYGGPVANSDDAGFLGAAWSAYVEWCAEHAVIAEFARFHPVARNQRFYGGAVSENRQTVTVELDLPQLESQYSTLVRRKLKRAAASGAAACWSRDPLDWARYGAFYRAAMSALDADARYHFADGYFGSIAALDEAWLCICESSSGWLSAGVYLFGDDVVEYHLGANSAQGYDAATPQLMQHSAALRGRELGRKLLYLGGGIRPEPDNPLLFHKLGFSRRTLPFFVGQAVHNEPAYWALAAKAGFDRSNPPPRILFD